MSIHNVRLCIDQIRSDPYSEASCASREALLHYLKELGCPAALARWVVSYLVRLARAAYDAVTLDC